MTILEDISLLTFVPFLFLSLAAIANAVMDRLADKPHFDSSIFSKLNPNFWSKEVSWRNKYKDIDGDGEGDIAGGFRFRAPFTILNNFLDSWHIFQGLWGSFMILATVYFDKCLFYIDCDPKWYGYIILFAVFSTLYISVFNIFYNHVFKR